MSVKIYSSGYKAIDAVTGGGIQAGRPWLIIDERPKKVRDKWFPATDYYQGLSILRDPSSKLTHHQVGVAVLNDKHLVVITSFRSVELETMCSVVLRVSAGELVITKNQYGARTRVKLAS